MNDKIFVPLYMLNNYLKFERKVYSIFGIPTGRPIRLKVILYGLGFGVVELILYFTPILNIFFRNIPFIFLLVAPFGFATLLADIGTEGRQPLSFFKSFFEYTIRNISKANFIKDNRINKINKLNFNNYIRFKDEKVYISSDEAENMENAEIERERAIKYMDRIRQPDEFFRKQMENKKKKSFFTNFRGKKGA